VDLPRNLILLRFVALEPSGDHRLGPVDPVGGRR
jgi:hypothetical protein